MAPDEFEGAPFDEDHDPPATPRLGYARMLAALRAVDLGGLTEAVARHLAEHGVTFGGRPFVVDPVPRLIAGAEWDELARGLAQRARALNAFLHDAYGERRIVRAGIVAGADIDDAEGYEPDLLGRLPARSSPAAIIGFDLVRAPSGRFLVLEDNMRTPSGIAYLSAARTAVTTVLPEGLPTPRPVLPAIHDLLRATLRAAAPGDAADPLVVVVTDGPDNVAFYEHERLARELGVPLVTPSQLRLHDETLLVRLSAGDEQPVDVVYRRTDEDRIRDDDGGMTPIAELLVPAWLSGRIGLVNAFGNGVADDKLVHGHVEDFVRFYLGEEPIVRSVPTMALDTPDALEEAIADLERLVVKPRHGHGGAGVVIGAGADPEQLDAARAQLRAHPERYIVQPIVALSRHPTIVEGEFALRHLDLRPFAFAAGPAGEDVRLAPGGLSRVAFDAGDMVVNSSRNGGGKDTWVIDA